MDELEERRTRRSRLRRAARPEPAPETASSLLPGAPRIGPLDALLREVDSLRLSLETDLTLAASAVEHGAFDVASDILDGDREGLREFELRALGHVAELAKPRRRRLRVPVAPFVAAAAVIGFLIGVVPHTHPGRPSSPPTLTADASFLKLSHAAARGETAAIVTAASELHSQLAIAVTQARTDPAAANRALGLLAAERSVIEQSGDRSTLLTTVLAASTQLTRAIMSALPAVPHPTPPAPVVLPAVTASPRPVVRPSPQASTAASSPQASRATPPVPQPTTTAEPTVTGAPTHTAPGLPSAPALGR